MSTDVPCGAWPSPITSELITRAAAAIGTVTVDGDDLWWSELRPEAGGQVQLVRRTPDGEVTDVLPEGFSARTRVHEYGGGAWTANRGWVYFANWSDQRLYRMRPGGEPEALTPEPVVPMGDRYADLTVAGPFVLCVREHHDSTLVEARNEIVAVPADGGEATVLVTGPDFVAAPRVSPSGDVMAWVQWDHPRMPWDGTELRVAPVVLTVGAATKGADLFVAGGPDESVVEPRWSPEGILHFLSDRTDWWNLYRMESGSGRTVPVTALEAEIALPHWVFGGSRYVFLPGGRIVCGALRGGVDHLMVVGADGSMAELDIGLTDIAHLAASGSHVVVTGASFTTETVIGVLDLDAGDPGALEVVRPPRDLGLDPGILSVPEAITFPSGEREAHALYYPPTNPDVEPVPGELPPLIVKIHGGPTSAARPRLNLSTQYWTSRGFGVVDVNYGGSTGFGRPYRRLLDGAWGIVDVEDCIAAARHLGDSGRADPKRLAITGGSAGGFTVLAALCASDVFAAGASHYGVADLEALATDTHKFESRYLDGLVGPYPEEKDTYVDRSPIRHVDQLSSPLIVFQGLEDEIVPPNQAEMIVEAVRAKGVPVAYVPFEGEQHGFRKAENIRAALDGELVFYGRVFGFSPAGDLPDLEIDNLA